MFKVYEVNENMPQFLHSMRVRRNAIISILVYYFLMKIHGIQSFGSQYNSCIIKQRRTATASMMKMIPRVRDGEYLDEKMNTATSSQQQQDAPNSAAAITTTRRRMIAASLFASTIPPIVPIVMTPSISNAMYTDPVTKILLPSQGEIEAAIPPSFDDDDNPFESLDKASFSRLDQTSDVDFYKNPRFTEHVDENAVQILTQYISNNVLKPNDSVLDLCSSWTSHIDRNRAEELNLKRISGLGMNQEELQANNVLTDYTVVDLNAKSDVKLPYDDSVFDVVLCQLSIDYLIYPLNVLKEVGRVLKPGGRVVILFSNRLFIQKVSCLR